MARYADLDAGSPTLSATLVEAPRQFTGVLNAFRHRPEAVSRQTESYASRHELRKNSPARSPSPTPSVGSGQAQSLRRMQMETRRRQKLLEQRRRQSEMEEAHRRETLLRERRLQLIDQCKSRRDSEVKRRRRSSVRSASVLADGPVRATTPLRAPASLASGATEGRRNPVPAVAAAPVRPRSTWTNPLANMAEYAAPAHNIDQFAAVDDQSDVVTMVDENARHDLGQFMKLAVQQPRETASDRGVSPIPVMLRPVIHRGAALRTPARVMTDYARSSGGMVDQLHRRLSPLPAIKAFDLKSIQSEPVRRHSRKPQQDTDEEDDILRTISKLDETLRTLRDRNSLVQRIETDKREHLDRICNDQIPFLSGANGRVRSEGILQAPLPSIKVASPRATASGGEEGTRFISHRAGWKPPALVPHRTTVALAKLRNRQRRRTG